MFGLPATTTAIMVGVLGFWVVYTLVFYFTTGGWSVEPWSPSVRVGLASDDEGNGALVVESTMPYEGKLVYRLPAHALQRAIPWDWPRLNSWPRWLPPEALADVGAVKGAEGVTVDALASGLPISLESGGRVVLGIRMKAER